MQEEEKQNGSADTPPEQQKKNKKREKNYNPFNEPPKDLLAEFEKIKKAHAEKENEE